MHSSLPGRYRQLLLAVVGLVLLLVQASSGRAASRNPCDLESLWTALGEDNAQHAYEAMQALVLRSEQAVSMMKDRLRPVSAPDARLIDQYIADLDSDQFAVRQQASEALEKLGDRAETALQKKLAENPALEVRQRLEQLLTMIEEEPLTPECLRALRGIEVLEHIGSPAARQLLKQLAAGAEGSRLTRQARASLQRLSQGGS